MSMHAEENVDDALLVSLFRLGEALFGIPAAQIQEVVQVGSLTPTHHAPAWVVGIRNLRGRIVTVIDLAMRLGLGEADRSPSCRIQMVDAEGELTGLLVDRVEDTVFLDAGMMCAAPTSLCALEGAALRGVYRCNYGLAALLDHRLILLPPVSR
jgi:purine-binding chemotaxis protein CheW